VEVAEELSGDGEDEAVSALLPQPARASVATVTVRAAVIGTQ
jgi:hypothetical protein